MAAGGFIQIYNASESLTILDAYLPRYEGWRAIQRESSLPSVWMHGFPKQSTEERVKAAVILESTTFEEAESPQACFRRK